MRFLLVPFLLVPGTLLEVVDVALERINSTETSKNQYLSPIHI
jgi:hypothetical protein